MDIKELRKQAESEENDLKRLGIYKKIIREECHERFEKYKQPLLKAGYNLTEYQAQGKITISPTTYGIVDYYPKANRILVRDGNYWESDGLKWIINNLLNK
jgi:hypothetical protein